LSGFGVGSAVLQGWLLQNAWRITTNRHAGGHSWLGVFVKCPWRAGIWSGNRGIV